MLSKSNDAMSMLSGLSNPENRSHRFAPPGTQVSAHNTHSTHVVHYTLHMPALRSQARAVATRPIAPPHDALCGGSLRHAARTKWPRLTESPVQRRYAPTREFNAR